MEKGTLTRCFPVNFKKFSRTPFLQNTFFTEHLRVTASDSPISQGDIFVESNDWRAIITDP